MTNPFASIKQHLQAFRRRTAQSLRDGYDVFLGDMLRIHKLLPGTLRIKVWALFGSMLVSAALEVLSLTVLAFLGMSVAAPESTAQHPVFVAIKRFLPFVSDLYTDPIRFVLLVAVFVFLVFTFKNVLQGLIMWSVNQLSESVSLYLGSKIFHRFLCSPYMWHLSSDSSRSFNALSGRSSMAAMLMQILSMYVYGLTAIALFVALLSATPGAIFSAIAGTAMAALLIYKTIRSRVDQAGMTAMLSAQGQSKSLMDAINGIREVLIYRQQKTFHDAYLKACEEGARARSFLSIAPPIPTWILECVGIGIIPLSIWVLAHQEGVSLARVASVISLVMLTAWRILPMVNRVLSAMIAVRSVRPQTMQTLEVFEELDQQPTVELPAPDPDFTFDSDISMDKVCFRYPGAAQDSLNSISLTIPKGAQVGFIGVSGAGKSTIVGILSGLIEPTQGRILVDGKALGPSQLAAYMPRVGYVPQSPYILSGTVADNVAFSHWGREYDRDQVLHACRKAALDLVEYGQGIDTPVGERGAGLSGGQAQRVSIARAMFGEPDILILDESTSSLDQANEEAIMETINSYRGRITTIIVAHRLTTLDNCDYLFWLENGTLVAHGEREEMLSKYKSSMTRTLV